MTLGDQIRELDANNEELQAIGDEVDLLEQMHGAALERAAVRALEAGTYWRAYREVVEQIRALHKPVSVHSPISNPNFYYKVCPVCAGPDGDAHLWPCPTFRIVDRPEV